VGEVFERLASTEPHGTRVRSSSALRRIASAGATHSSALSAMSGSIEQPGRDPLEIEREQWNWAISLRTELRAWAVASERRRRRIRGMSMLAVALGVGFVTLLVFAGTYVVRERDRTTAERNRLAVVLLDESAATTRARLEGLFRPVHGALMMATRWARLGLLESDEPERLNDLFMPVLEGVPVATSMLRADASGREYMLLRTQTGWRTRTTVRGRVPEIREWDDERRQVGSSEGNPTYDPLVRPWYEGGAALRAAAAAALREGLPQPVHWTTPYEFFTTKDPGISVSTPVTSPSGRQFVIAFDVKLADISNFTESWPEGIEQGQVFVLDEAEQVLGLPRETLTIPDRRTTVLLEPIAALAEQAPLSHQAWVEWNEQARPTEPFRIAIGEDYYWVEFSRIAEPELPHLWIGVVLPESHFVN
jgi:hypothetical protein